jgi:hypothetical protein
VVETKGSLFTDDLRENEAAKIICGEAHFNALATDFKPCQVHKGDEDRRFVDALLSEPENCRWPAPSAHRAEIFAARRADRDPPL